MNVLVPLSLALAVSVSSTPALASTCTFKKTSEPSPTRAAPPDACKVEHFDKQGQLIRVIRRAGHTRNDGIAVKVETVLDGNGKVTRRHTIETGPHGVLAEKFESPGIKGAFVPNTFGQKANWANRTVYDEKGRVLRSEHDLGIDGTLETLVVNEWGPGHLRRRRQFHGGKLHTTENFDRKGRMTLKVEAHGTETRVRFTATGAISEWFVGTELRTRTVTVGPTNKPHSVETVSFTKDGKSKLVSRSVVTYDAKGRKRVEVVERDWMGVMKKVRTEFGPLGSRLSMLETQSDDQCRLRRELSRFGFGKAEHLLSRVETCDGRLVDSVKATFDKDGRKLTLVRVAGVGDGSRKTRREERESWTYDACGAMKTHTIDHGKGSPTIRHFTWSQHGKLTSITIGGRVRVSRSYDTAGNMTAADGRFAYTYDAKGRLASITNKRPSRDQSARIVMSYRCP